MLNQHQPQSSSPNKARNPKLEGLGLFRNNVLFAIETISLPADKRPTMVSVMCNNAFRLICLRICKMMGERMVKATLSYNPYLLETEVSFNGNPPRINSLVEKYRNSKLQEWISEIPAYFHDEMNGYDFELIFTGTELDFEEVNQSFLQAGVGKDSVKITQGKQLASRRDKVVEINGLLEWLDANPSRKFDWMTFRLDHQELFEDACSLVAIGDAGLHGRLFADIDIAVDTVQSAEELRKTDLAGTPVLFYLDLHTVKSLQSNLKALLKRPDIDQSQLFFCIDSKLGDYAERLIMDLGVKAPQIVSSASDALIHRYLDIYPVADRIHDVIVALHEQTLLLESALNEENKQSAIANKDTHEALERLDDTLNQLNVARDLIQNQTGPGYSVEISAAKIRFIHSLNRWRAKKTKIVGDDEAHAFANEFELVINQQFGKFRQEVIREYLTECATVLARGAEWYSSAHYEDGFTAEGIAVSPAFDYLAPRVAPDLLQIKEMQKVKPKEDFFENFGKLFAGGGSDSEEPELEAVYYCEKWRSYAERTMDPLVESMIKEAYDALDAYYEQVQGMYITHLDDLLRTVADKKERITSQLSEEERLLQADNDWLNELREKLHSIERS